MSHHASTGLSRRASAGHAAPRPRHTSIGQAVIGVAHCVRNIQTGLDGGFYILESDIEEKYGKIPNRGFEMFGRNIDRLKEKSN